MSIISRIMSALGLDEQQSNTAPTAPRVVGASTTRANFKDGHHVELANRTIPGVPQVSLHGLFDTEMDRMLRGSNEIPNNSASLRD